MHIEPTFSAVSEGFEIRSCGEGTEVAIQTPEVLYNLSMLKEESEREIATPNPFHASAVRQERVARRSLILLQALQSAPKYYIDCQFEGSVEVERGAFEVWTCPHCGAEHQEEIDDSDYDSESLVDE